MEMNLSSPQLIEAVRLWAGWGQSTAPSRNDQRLTDHLSEHAAAALLPLIKLLENDFYSSDARITAANLQEMRQLASEQFKQKHPGVAEEIVEVLAWCYTFDFK